MACTQGEAVSLALGAVATFVHKLKTEPTNSSLSLANDDKNVSSDFTCA